MDLLAFLAAIGVLVLCTIYVALLSIPELVLKPGKNSKGNFVAEIWLVWPVCRGSTMYRQRFRWEWQARLFARFYALVLDGQLPRGWQTTDYEGYTVHEAYDFEICFGVRPMTPAEEKSFTALWATALPGSAVQPVKQASANAVRDVSDYLHEGNFRF